MHVTVSVRQRFSIRSLLDLAARAQTDRIGVGRILLGCVADRLAAQEDRLRHLSDALERTTTRVEDDDVDENENLLNNNNNVIRTSAFHTPLWKLPPPATKQSTSDEDEASTWRTRALPRARKRLETLRWIHSDTRSACQHVLNLRSTTTDHHDDDGDGDDDDDGYYARLLRQTLTQVRSRHARTVESLAEVVVEDLRPHGMASCTDAVDAILQQRLGIQLLCEHYVELCRTSSPKPHGTVDVQRSVEDAILDAWGETRILTEAYHPVIPHAQVTVEAASSSSSSPKATFVGPWLHYVLVEVLKNAVTATVERHYHHENDDDDDEHHDALPPIVVSMREEDSKTTITVVDRGVGVTHSSSTMTTFPFAVASRVWDRLDEQTTYATVRSPVRGMGVGLSLSAAMMRHFGGSLRLEKRRDDSDDDDDDGGGGTRAVVEIPTDLTILEPAG